MYKPITNHIIELDEQVNYRIRRFTKATKQREEELLENCRNSLTN